MAYLKLDNVCVEYPVYTGRAHSLRNQLVYLASAGRLEQETRRNVVIRALDNVSLSFADGDAVGLVGRNGAGKTTLLKTMAGIYYPKSGTVQSSGDVTTFFEINAGMDPELTGYENIRRRGLLLGMSPTEIEGIVPDVEEFSELGEYLSLPLRTYSAGMSTRLSFAVATSTVREILLIDEIIGAGDASFQEKASARIERELRKAKILVLASHDDQLIRRFCSQCIWMRRGQVVEIGPTEQILESYNAAIEG